MTKKYKNYNVPDIGDYVPSKGILEDITIAGDNVDELSELYCTRMDVEDCKPEDCEHCLFGPPNKERDVVFMEWHKDRAINEN